MLLPGSQLEVEEITEDHYGTTVYARQRPCVLVRSEAAAIRAHCVPSTRVMVTGAATPTPRLSKLIVREV